ncbi:MAG: CHC2 zinc finger domain-containing protein [Clostridium celatum]|nr:CHC2 zinc finger domain-containing protein [Clostridium celatum]
MNIFKEVKERSDILEVARAMGLDLNRYNKGLCPFHNEKTPSFSICSKRQLFKCFGCGECRDSIALVSKLKGLNNYESALYINKLLNLGIEVKEDKSLVTNNKAKDNKISKIENYNNSKVIIEAFEKWENDTFLLLSDYRRYLSEKDDEETAEMLNIIDYYLDIFTSNDIEEKLEFYKYNKKVVQSINERFIKKDS